MTHHAAALTYYALMSLFPTVLLGLSLARKISHGAPGWTRVTKVRANNTRRRCARCCCSGDGIDIPHDEEGPDRRSRDAHFALTMQALLACNFRRSALDEDQQWCDSGGPLLPMCAREHAAP